MQPQSDNSNLILLWLRYSWAVGPKQGYVSSLSSDTRQSSTQSHNPTRRLLNPRQEGRISHFATLSLIMNKRVQRRGLFKLQQSIIYGLLNADGVSRYASANTCQRSSERCWHTHTTRKSGMNVVVSRTLCPHVSCMGVFLKKKETDSIHGSTMCYCWLVSAFVYRANAVVFTHQQAWGSWHSCWSPPP